MLLGGDEIGRTQRGSNNAYCQDNDISWYNWDLLKEESDLHTFTQGCIQLRNRFPSLRRTTFFSNADPAIKWHGLAGGNVNWGQDKAVGCWLSGKATHTGADEDCDDLFMIFNADINGMPFNMPVKDDSDWKLILQTAEPVIKKHIVEVPARTTLVFRAKQPPPAPVVEVSDEKKNNLSPAG
jgi:glycogen operon protein